MKNFVDYYGKCAESLSKRIADVAGTSPFYKRLYRRLLDKMPGDAPLSLQEYQKVPYTNKDDLKRQYPYGFLACEKDRLVAYFESSGTTDGTIRSSLTGSFRTKADFERDVERRSLRWITGIEKGDVAGIFLPYSLTTSGFTYHQAFDNIGMVPVALDQGNSMCSYSRVYDTMLRLRAKVLVCSNPLLLADVIRYSDSEDLFDLPDLKYIVAAGVPFSNAHAKIFQERYEISLLRSYGLSEFGSVGVPCERGGMHVHPDFFVEIMNPKSGEDSLLKGELGGEIVVSDLRSEASPIIRYKTSDAGRLYFGHCDCGLAAPRIEVFGRVKDTIRDKETLLFPTSFQEAFFGLESVSPIHKVVVSGDDDMMIKLYVQQIRESQREIEELHSRVKKITPIALELQVVKWGTLFADLYGQTVYRNTQTTKNMSFHDERAGKWTITY